VASSIDQQFIEYIVKSLVSQPDKVSIERRIDEKGVLLELTVDPEDLGRVIGKRGATAQSLRTLLRALGTKNDARYNLKIIDNGRPSEPSSRSSDDDTSTVSRSDDTDEPTNGNDDIVTATDEEETEDHSSVVSKTRKELEELDDLDV
jgi:predicted RNA-binding protein YlqC (UPF0109 family)